MSDGASGDSLSLPFANLALNFMVLDRVAPAMAERGEPRPNFVFAVGRVLKLSRHPLQISRDIRSQSPPHGSNILTSEFTAMIFLPSPHHAERGSSRKTLLFRTRPCLAVADTGDDSIGAVVHAVNTWSDDRLNLHVSSFTAERGRPRRDRIPPLEEPR